MPITSGRQAPGCRDPLERSDDADQRGERAQKCDLRLIGSAAISVWKRAGNRALSCTNAGFTGTAHFYVISITA